MSNQENPYQAPQSNLEHEVIDAHLASRGARFAAALIDGLILLAICIPALLGFNYFDGVMEDDWSPSFIQEVMATILYVFIFLVVNGYLLNKYGQTIGKRLLGIAIRDMQGNLCPLVPMVLKREILWTVVAAIPISGGLIALADILMIFRKDRRCLHDLVAGTQVVSLRAVTV